MAHISLLPVFKGAQHVAVIIDGFQNLRERHIVPLGKEITQRIDFTGIERRDSNVKSPILAQLQVGIASRATIRCLVLSGERGIQCG